MQSGLPSRKSSLSTMYNMATGDSVARGDSGLGNGGDSEEADRRMTRGMFRRDICQSW